MMSLGCATARETGFGGDAAGMTVACCWMTYLWHGEGDRGEADWYAGVCVYVWR